MFKWARMCVCSRNYGGKFNGIVVDYMAPLADTLYHSKIRHSNWNYEDELNCFSMTAKEII